MLKDLRKSVGSSAVLLWLVAACSGPELGSNREAVIGGTQTQPGQFPAAGALVLSFQGQTMFYCSGTLIAPNVVLTAAHCLDPSFLGGMIPSFTLDLDANTATGAALHDGIAAHPHPNFDINFEPAGVDQAYDIGLLILQSPITSVPYALLPSPAEAARIAADDAVTIVGYGATSAGAMTAGVKFHANTTIGQIGTYELWIGAAGEPQNCEGDSGGPALENLGTGSDPSRVIGVVSRGPENCDLGGIDTRVDAYLAWIQSIVTLPCGSGLSPPCDTDAGQPVPDASSPDAAAQVDAAQPGPDASAAGPDAGPSFVDAATPRPDAEAQSMPDAALLVGDASVAAGPDAGPMPMDQPAQGCGCAFGGSAPLAFLLLAPGLCWQRRRRPILARARS